MKQKIFGLILMGTGILLVSLTLGSRILELKQREALIAQTRRTQGIHEEAQTTEFMGDDARFSFADGPALLLENLPLLEQMGFACEDFGGGALLVREVPADIDAADTVPTLEEFAERLRTGRSPDEKREALLHTMACKAAIKGGWVSDPAELRVLVDRVQSGEIKYCPHGRPVAVKLTKYELEKMFKRA